MSFDLEFMDEQIAAGVTLSQLKNLLLTGGNQDQREVLLMQIISNLVQRKQTSIIFDFYGNWSKLLRYFKDSPYQHDFLYYRLGHNFQIDLLHSGAPQDDDNIKYLELIINGYCLAFKENRQIIEVLHSSIQNLVDKETDFNLAMGLTEDTPWNEQWNKNKRGMSDGVLFYLRRCKESNLFLFLDQESQSSGLDLECVLDPRKTVILDLSESVDLQQKVFATFILLAKIIQYKRKVPRESDKIILVPEMDAFFNATHLERDFKNDSGKIDMFLRPLVKYGLGLLCSIDHFSHVHDNLFHYFNNYITFSTKQEEDLNKMVPYFNLFIDHGKGFYGSKRKDSYQLQYLKRMEADITLIKRDDIEYPFPIKLVDLETFLDINSLSPREIRDYMNRVDPNYQEIELRIFNQLKDTLLEKDLGNYQAFWPEIFKFLGTLKKVENLGNMHESNTKKLLLEAMRDKANSFKIDHKALLRIRDTLFDTLVKHGYLKEVYPNLASGSQTIRPSYRVDGRFERLLDEYQNILASKNSPIRIKGGREDFFSDFLEDEEDSIIREGDSFEPWIKEQASLHSQLYWIAFKMNEHIKRDNFKVALELGKNRFRAFINSLLHQFREVHHPEKNGSFGKKGMQSFLDSLAREINISRDLLQEYINDILQPFDSNYEVLEEHVQRMHYTLLMFSDQIR